MPGIPNQNKADSVSRFLVGLLNRAARAVESFAGRVAVRTERAGKRWPGAERVRLRKLQRRKKTVDPPKKRRYNKPKQTT